MGNKHDKMINEVTGYIGFGSSHRIRNLLPTTRTKKEKKAKKR